MPPSPLSPPVRRPLPPRSRRPPPRSPPKRPSAADVELLVAAQGLELAALELYVTALAGDASFDDLTRSTLGSIRQHHDAYAEALGGLLGRDSITTPDAALLSARSGDFGGSDAAAIITAAHDLEKALVATHTGLVGQLTGTDGTGLIASILVVEARHIPVLATLLGLDPVDDIDAFVTNDATPLTPA